VIKVFDEDFLKKVQQTVLFWKSSTLKNFYLLREYFRGELLKTASCP
jgi:hypothetical protein